MSFLWSGSLILLFLKSFLKLCIISCLLFVAAVETFTGLLSDVRERNLKNKETISGMFDVEEEHLTLEAGETKMPGLT